MASIMASNKPREKKWQLSRENGCRSYLTVYWLGLVRTATITSCTLLPKLIKHSAIAAELLIVIVTSSHRKHLQPEQASKLFDPDVMC